MRKKQPRPRRPGLDDDRYRTNRETLKRIGTHICQICTMPIDLQLKYPHPLSWSCDHVIPRRYLAPDDPRHWQLEFLREVHARCNSSRGDKLITPAIPTSGPALTTSIDW